MGVQIVVPALGESVTEATVAQWLKKVGDAVARDEPVVELETDKVTLEVNAADAGVISEITVPAGESVAVGAVLGSIEPGAAAVEAPAAKTAVQPAEKASAAPKPAGGPAASVPAAAMAAAASPAVAAASTVTAFAMPAAAKMIAEHGLEEAFQQGSIAGTGKGGRVTKEDVQTFLAGGAPAAQVPEGATVLTVPAFERPTAAERPEKDREERVPMSKLRKTIAARLKDAQNTAAMLTTFNEVDMTALMAVRADYRDEFEKKHGVRLGFMSFFVKACVTALKEFPAVNGEIDGDDLIYKNYYDVGVAVGTPQGLVVPVVRDADRRSFAEVENEINALARKARDGKLSMADLTGGTFTITNGGVYGSLMSTPILNPPQSGILGMHKVQQRPMVQPDGSIQARPMMYLALSYDHRIIDGREAVSFLVRVKECIEDPKRILLEV